MKASSTISIIVINFLLPSLLSSMPVREGITVRSYSCDIERRNYIALAPKLPSFLSEADRTISPSTVGSRVFIDSADSHILGARSFYKIACGMTAGICTLTSIMVITSTFWTLKHFQLIE